MREKNEERGGRATPLKICPANIENGVKVVNIENRRR